MPLFDNLTPTLLIVDDDSSAIRVLSKTLAPLGQIRFATEGEQALELARSLRPDLILLDAQMPGMSGFEVCQALKAEPALAELPVIFITSHAEESMEEAGLALGAVDFIGKPIHPAIVLARVRTHLRLKLAIDRLNQQAHTDGLTGLANRRILDQTVSREWQRCRRSGEPLSLLMLDIDFFKRYNDHFGHLQGDQCLIAVARALGRCVQRATDLLARYGGEEFALVLPGTDREGARHMAAQLIEHVRALDLPHPMSEFGRVSICVGAASFDSHSQGWALPGERAAASEPEVQRLLAFADQALYQAKQAGRNQSACVSIDLPPF